MPLTLTRAKGEQLVIENRILITIIDFSNQRGTVRFSTEHMNALTDKDRRVHNKYKGEPWYYESHTQAPRDKRTLIMRMADPRLNKNGSRKTGELKLVFEGDAEVLRKEIYDRKQSDKENPTKSN